MFGPRPRDYSFKLNKKLKEVARRSALTYKVKEEAFVVLDAVSFKAPNTKEYLKLITDLSVANKKSLIVLPTEDNNVLLSSRNLKNTKVTTANLVNTYDIVNADTVIAIEGAVKIIEESLN